MSEDRERDSGASRVIPSESEPSGEGLRFDDPYWDDAFCAWWDPGLRTCCG